MRFLSKSERLLLLVPKWAWHLHASGTENTAWHLAVLKAALLLYPPIPPPSQQAPPASTCVRAGFQAAQNLLKNLLLTWGLGGPLWWPRLL